MSKLEGKPPKQVEEIRARLQSIHGNTPVVAQGSMAEDADQGQQIIVASFYDYNLAQRFQRLLTQNGIYSKSYFHKRMKVFTVDRADLKLASAFSIDFRSKNSDQRSTDDVRRLDFLIFGSIIGMTIGSVFVFDSKLPSVAVSFAIAMAGIGAIIGHIADCTLLTARQTGKFRIGLWEFLLGASVPPLIIFVLRLIPKLLFE